MTLNDTQSLAIRQLRECALFIHHEVFALTDLVREHFHYWVKVNQPDLADEVRAMSVLDKQVYDFAGEAYREAVRTRGADARMSDQPPSIAELRIRLGNLQSHRDHERRVFRSAARALYADMVAACGDEGVSLGRLRKIAFSIPELAEPLSGTDLRLTLSAEVADLHALKTRTEGHQPMESV